jgi:hypothetical protein
MAVSGAEAQQASVMETVAAAANGTAGMGQRLGNGHGGIRDSGTGLGNGRGIGKIDTGIVLRPVADKEPVALFVFKTMSDPFAGRISFFKVSAAWSRPMPTVENYTRRGRSGFRI